MSTITEHEEQEVMDIIEIPDRCYALTLGSGWREVVDTPLSFVKRFA